MNPPAGNADTSDKNQHSHTGGAGTSPVGLYFILKDPFVSRACKMVGSEAQGLLVIVLWCCYYGGWSVL